MASLREYCEKMSTEQLEELLRAESEGQQELLPEVALLIHEILAGRDSGKPDEQEAHWRFDQNNRP